ncbi:MAG TPA: DNA-3-methyladenine glycosylase I, partial [Gaiellaceae bacterium]|nr:DNA-3-methyladenine glycosylase I [Gaiellaceae bacterium]
PLAEVVWQHRDAPDGSALAGRLRALGFRFVGPVTVYAALQACGVVNGHRPECWVREAVEAERAAL